MYKKVLILILIVLSFEGFSATDGGSSGAGPTSIPAAGARDAPMTAT